MDYFPTLYTERLKLRKIEVEDVPALVKYANNRKIADRIVNIPFPYREPDAALRISFVVRGFKQKVRYVFAIIHKEKEELIGEISIHFLDKHNRHGQLAYWLGEPFWNQGIISEAAKAVIKFGFEKLDLDLIFAECSADNKGSEKVLLNNGLKFQKTNSQYLLYKMTKEEYGLQPKE